MARGIVGRALKSVEQADADVVVADLRADRGLRIEAGELVAHQVAGIHAQELALVGLLELVALVGIVEEVGEIVEEVQRRIDAVGLDDAGAAIVALAPAQAERIALGVAAVGLVDRAEPAEAPSDTARTGIWSVECQELV